VAILDLYEGATQPGHALPARDPATLGGSGLDRQHDGSRGRLGNKVPALSYDVSISRGDGHAPWHVRGSDGSVIIVTGSTRWKTIMGEGRGREAVLLLHPSVALPFFRDRGITRRKSTAFGVFPFTCRRLERTKPFGRLARHLLHVDQAGMTRVIQPTRAG